jgi:sterol desaturase/sphingolipid hydroxylase (fatty acid hydroxylase superfamily)
MQKMPLDGPAVVLDTPPADPAARARPSLLQAWLARLWQGDLAFGPGAASRALLVVLSLAGLALWLWPQAIVSDPGSLRAPQAVRVFYMVPDLRVAGLDATFASWLVGIAIARAAFNVLIGGLDVALHERVTGRPFDWPSMINVAVVNAVLIFAGVFALMNAPVREALAGYDQLVAHVPTLVHLNGALALVVAALIGDFCFYWSHRACHSVRVLWNLGHIYHHRNRSLTQLTCAIEPPMLLQAAGGVALLLPPLAKLFTTDLNGAGIALVVLMVADTWTDPSHSPVMYALEARVAALRALRRVFVTVGVHFTHHATEVHGPDGKGCNFGARLTVWDRVFGTYSEPTRELPPTGLFDPRADLCVNPLRYLLQPVLRLVSELERNAPRDWPRLLFGSTDHEPPNPSSLPR